MDDSSPIVESVLKEISDIVSSLDDSQKVLDALVKLVTRMLRVAKCSLMMIEPGTDQMWIRASCGLPPEVVRSYRGRVGEGIAGWVAKEGKPLLIEDVESHPIFGRRSGAQYNTRSLLSVPLRLRGNVIGVLNVNNKLAGGVFTQADELLLSVVANFAVIALEKARMREIEMAKERLDADLHSARRIQESILPKSFPMSRNFECITRYLAAREIAGDFYDFIPMEDGNVLVALGDVSGKGMPAALHMVRVVSYLRAAARIRHHPGGIMSFANDMLAEQWDAQSFVTANLILLNESRGNVILCSAGHPPPLLWRAKEKTIASPPVEQGLPLCVHQGEQYACCDLQLETGDVLLAYTDGVTEARDASDALFGVERLERVLNRYNENVEKLVEAITDAVFDFMGSAQHSDDITLLAIRKR